MIKILSAAQTGLLKEISKNKKISSKFYLSGGTALAAYYLGHRYSEDLDFFSETEVDSLSVSTYLTKIKKKFKIKKIDLSTSYNRNIFFLHLPNEIIKTEFTYYPFPPIEKGQTLGNLRIDSLIDLAVNKLFTIYQRSVARDYIDLYCIISKHSFTIKQLNKYARAKFDFNIDPIQLGTQFIKAKDAKDFPRMIWDVKAKDWQEFFISEAKKLKKDILK